MLGRLAALILPLSLDTFAVSAALALGGLSHRDRTRISATFTAFEGGAPAIGLLLAHPLGTSLGHTADYLAIATLVGLGLFILLHDDDDGVAAAGFKTARGWSVIALALAISVDEIAVGFTLGLLRTPVLPALLAIAAQALLISQLGLRLGHRLTHARQELAEKAGGIALLSIGVILAVSDALT